MSTCPSSSKPHAPRQHGHRDTGTTSVSQSNPATCHQFKSQKRHFARLHAFQLLKEELAEGMHKTATNIFLDSNGAMMQSLPKVIMESFAGFGVVKSSELDPLVAKVRALEAQLTVLLAAQNSTVAQEQGAMEISCPAELTCTLQAAQAPPAAHKGGAEGGSCVPRPTSASLVVRERTSQDTAVAQEQGAVVSSCSSASTSTYAAGGQEDLAQQTAPAEATPAKIFHQMPDVEGPPVHQFKGEAMTHKSYDQAMAVHHHLHTSVEDSPDAAAQEQGAEGSSDIPFPETRSDVMDLLYFVEGFLTPGGQAPNEQVGAAIAAAAHARAIIDDVPSHLPEGWNANRMNDDLGQVLRDLRQQVIRVDHPAGHKFHEAMTLWNDLVGD